MKSLIDSNILVYAYNQESIFHESAKKFLDLKLKEGSIVFSIQNLFEAYAVLTSRLEKPLQSSEAYEIVHYYPVSPHVTIVYPTQKSSIIALDIANKRHILGIRSFDTALIGQMVENNIKTIYTKNVRHFSGIEGIQAIDPLL